VARRSRPRAGSLAFYPRKRAVRETPKFRALPAIAVQEAKPLNFLGYKVGMTHVLGTDTHERGATFGQEISIPVTIVEAPPLRVFGIRAYGKAGKGYGLAAVTDVFAEKADRALLKKMPNFKRKKGKKAGEEKKGGVEKLDALGEALSAVVLLAHSQPKLASFGKKKPDIVEIALSGKVEEQLAYAKQALGREISVGDVFSELEFVDVKAVSKGKGMQGVVKRFGVKMQGRKAKKRRVVGSIGPWNPSTVMWTVPRPGQMGYHNRTEYNKKILRIGNSPETINPKGGFKNYGAVKNNFLVLSGSIPGPAKRAVALRKSIRVSPGEKHKIEGIDFIATVPKGEATVGEEEKLLHKAEVKKEEKKEKKSVEEEIMEAVGGSK
jgi:large subunit ribosomal protein L3